MFNYRIPNAPNTRMLTNSETTPNGKPTALVTFSVPDMHNPTIPKTIATIDNHQQTIKLTPANTILNIPQTLAFLSISVSPTLINIILERERESQAL